MKLGPIQTKWLAALRANPEQQATGSLGRPCEQKYCCLGKALMILKGDAHKENLSFGSLTSKYSFTSLLGHYEDLGLFDHVGNPKGLVKIEINGDRFLSLADANDTGATWPEIADWIEANPEKIFTKAV